MKTLVCLIALVVLVVVMGGCIQIPSVTTPQESPPITTSQEQKNNSVSFYTLTGRALDFRIIQPSGGEYNLLSGAPEGWYIVHYDSIQKVSGYVYRSLTPGIDTGWNEVTVYYVWVFPDGQKQLVRIKIRFDAAQAGIVETITPKDRGYPFIVEENPNKTGGYY